MLPVIVPGCEGVVITVTESVFELPEPHELFAFTEMVPPVVPAVAVIEFVVDDPAQPEGSVHV